MTTANKSTPEALFLRAYDELASALWRHAYYRVGSRELAEDMVSETFTRAWDSYRERDVANLKALLYRILHNLIIDHYRKARPQVSIDELGEGVAQVIAQPSRVSDLPQLPELLAKLPETWRQVILWRFVDDLPAVEIARLSGKTVTNVYVIIHRALRQLKKLAQPKP